MLSGLLSGLLGVGGGFVIIPALSRYTNLDSKSIVATSLAVIALVSLGSVITASLSGVMHWAVGAPFALGAVVGLVLGRQVASHLAGPRLQQLFAVTGMLAALLLAGGPWAGCPIEALSPASRLPQQRVHSTFSRCLPAKTSPPTLRFQGGITGPCRGNR